jgi:hypothetical protein
MEWQVLEALSMKISTEIETFGIQMLLGLTMVGSMAKSCTHFLALFTATEILFLAIFLRFGKGRQFLWLPDEERPEA